MPMGCERSTVYASFIPGTRYLRDSANLHVKHSLRGLELGRPLSRDTMTFV